MVNAGLVLEGGGMRGVYTAGVTDFFLDKGIMFFGVYGVSAGSCVACSYLSQQRGRAYRVTTDYLDNPDYCSMKSLLKTGDLFGADFLYRRIPDELDLYDYETFDQYPGQFYAVVTNAITGKAEYLPVKEMHRDIRKVRASSSLPLLARMVWIDGTPYMDGAIADSIPLVASQNAGFAKNVVVLTREAGFQKQPTSARTLAKIRYRHYPMLAQKLGERHIHYNETLDYIAKEQERGTTFVIQPRRKVEVGRLEKNLDCLYQLYQEGYEDAAACYEDLLQWLG